MPVTLHMNSLSHLAASETPVERLASPVAAHENYVCPRPLLSPQHLVAEHLAYHCYLPSARRVSPVVDGEVFRFPAPCRTPRTAAAATAAAVALPSIVAARHNSVCVAVDEAVVSCLELEDSLAGLSPCTD